ncbi:hypothetical protein FQR65_LT13591 [Abscondita terminalis]|nr:hypothetical protein FQR65_LT13591 [Abscondita terminalis]
MGSQQSKEEVIIAQAGNSGGQTSQAFGLRAMDIVLIVIIVIALLVIIWYCIGKKRSSQQNFLQKKSSTALASQLQTARQANKSISDFGKSIEELLYQLTITQAGDNVTALNVLQPVNEQSAISAFANGLNSAELRTIIKARNYSKLGQAITAAIDEEVSQKNSNHFLHMNYKRGNTNNFRNQHRFVRNPVTFTNGYRNNLSKRGAYQYFRGQQNRGNFQNYRSPRGRVIFHRNVSYYAQGNSPSDNSSSQQNSTTCSTLQQNANQLNNKSESESEFFRR